MLFETFNPIVALPSNTKGNDYAIGDLHGCILPLTRLMERVNFDPAVDRIISVGDLVDRGAESVEALRLQYEPWFFCVVGNHEAMLQTYLGQFSWRDSYPEQFSWREHTASDFIRNGGAWVLDYVADTDVQWELRHLVENMPLVFEVGTGADMFRVVHAEIPLRTLNPEDGSLDSARMDQYRDSVVWARSKAKMGMHQANKLGTPTGRALWDGGMHDASLPLVISGHTILPRPLYFGGQLFIDTGNYQRCGEAAHRNIGLTMVNIRKFQEGLKRGLKSPKALGFYRDTGYVPFPPRSAPS